MDLGPPRLNTQDSHDTKSQDKTATPKKRKQEADEGPPAKKLKTQTTPEPVIKSPIDLIREQVCQAAQLEREQRQRKMMDRTFKYGRFQWEHSGGTTIQKWYHGHKYEKLKEKMNSFGKRLNEPQLWKQELLQAKIAKIEKKVPLLMAETLRMKREASSEYGHFPTKADRYVFTELLGKGGFSEVWKTFDLLSLKFVATKVHTIKSTWSDDVRFNFQSHMRRELAIAKKLDHPRFVKLFDVFECEEEKDVVYMSMEYCSGYNLDYHLKKYGPLPLRVANFYAKQLCEGVAHLHQLNVIHYDLKPANIMFDHEGNIKITDFGLSKVISEYDDEIDLTSQGVGTYWYLPPECFKVGANKVKISTKVDVWSIGVIIYQTIFGKKPFADGMSQGDIVKNSVISDDLEVQYPKTLFKKPQEFISACLQTDPVKRPSIEELLSHPWIVGNKKKPKPTSEASNDSQTPEKKEKVLKKTPSKKKLTQTNESSKEDKDTKLTERQ